MKRWTILLGTAMAVAVIVHFLMRKPPAPRFAPGSREFMTNAVRLLEEQESEEAEKYWGTELAAQTYGGVFENLWDSLNAASNKFSVLKQFSVAKVVWATGEVLDQNGFQKRLDEMEGRGWRLVQCEFRHSRFKPKTESVFYFSAHLENAKGEERATLEGDITVKWDGAAVREIDASRLEVRSRKGPLPFITVLDLDVSPPVGSYFVDPLIVYDLDGDQQPEIILAAKNEVFRRDASGNWRGSPLCEDDPRLIFTAIVADFNGDGAADFLNAKFDGLFFHEGTRDGKFPGAARPVWQARPRLKYAQVMTAGDVDGDSDLDLFVGQYRLPYEKGNMPYPYFDANDGNPSFLLLNDGNGNFVEATGERGLGTKRNRRVYSSSFTDLDGDKDLDLLVVSDFAGVDAFENDGRGYFSEATRKWGLEGRAFGMAHGFADFNEDGAMDILVIGMTSPTADRLESLRQSRPYFVNDGGMRKVITFGNRLFFGKAGRGFQENAAGQSIARTGWSWGCGIADFDGDGFVDVYVANGHESRASVRDYDSEFWLHDIYVGDSKENPIIDGYFRRKNGRTRGAGWSYGGYEKNRFYLNEGGTNFTETAFLFGVGLEADSRNVVATDLNGDGAPDLAVTTFEVYPRARQTLKIFENHLPQQGRRRAVKYKVTGDSYRSQSR